MARTVALRRGNKAVARGNKGVAIDAALGADCCCSSGVQSSSGSGGIICCDFVGGTAVPTPLFLSVVGDGDCACMDNTVEVSFDESIDDCGGNQWVTPDPSTDSGTFTCDYDYNADAVLTCCPSPFPGTTGYIEGMQVTRYQPSALPPGTDPPCGPLDVAIPLRILSCDPFHAISDTIPYADFFDEDNVFPCCTGNLVFEVTE